MANIKGIFNFLNTEMATYKDLRIDHFAEYEIMKFKSLIICLHNIQKKKRTLISMIFYHNQYFLDLLQKP